MQTCQENNHENGAKATLETLKKDLDSVVGISATINKIESVKRRLSQLIESVQKEIAEVKPTGAGEKRQKERIKILGSVKTQTIKDVKEWNSFRDNLDKKVKTALNQKKTVELE